MASIFLGIHVKNKGLIKNEIYVIISINKNYRLNSVFLSRFEVAINVFSGRTNVAILSTTYIIFFSNSVFLFLKVFLQSCLKSATIYTCIIVIEREFCTLRKTFVIAFVSDFI